LLSLHRSCGVTLKPQGAPAPSPHTQAHPAKRHKDGAGAPRFQRDTAGAVSRDKMRPWKKSTRACAPGPPRAPGRVLGSGASPLTPAPPPSLRPRPSAARAKG